MIEKPSNALNAVGSTPMLDMKMNRKSNKKAAAALPLQATRTGNGGVKSSPEEERTDGIESVGPLSWSAV